uniref:Secreted protein n=1 Tax=Bursaphelenchus xylophilus TaxID=6326 RepID=A0A1I7S8D4_BURXY
MVDFAPFGGIHSFVGFSGAVDGRPFVVFKSMVFQLSNMRLLLLLVALLVVISAVEAGGWCWGRKIVRRAKDVLCSFDVHQFTRK